MSSPLGRNQRTLWQSYTNLPHKTRMTLGLVMGITGLVGLIVADKLEKVMPVTPQRSLDRTSFGTQTTTEGPKDEGSMRS